MTLKNKSITFKNLIELWQMTLNDPILKNQQMTRQSAHILYLFPLSKNMLEKYKNL